MSWIVSILTALFGLFLKRKESTAESLGVAETKAQDAQTNVTVLHKELEAAANGPGSNTDMVKLLQDGKL